MSKSDPAAAKKERKKAIRWVVTIFLVTILISGVSSLLSEIAMEYSSTVVAFLILLLATLITDYIVIGTFSVIATVPVYIGFFAHNLILAAIICIASFTIFWKHRENIGRMIRREEIGLRSTMRGEKRYDKQ